MKRREFITLLGGAAAAWPLTARAQQRHQVWRVGFISGATRATFVGSGLRDGFLQGMRDHGLIEGEDFIVEWRFADGNYQLIPRLADELVAQKVAVIVLGTAAAVRPVQETTKTIPIVMAYSVDPVGNGLVVSLSRPGGNTTGLASSLDDTAPKQMELMTEAVPGLWRIGVLHNPDNPHSAAIDSTERAARTAGLALITVKARTAADLELAFQTLANERTNGVIIFSDPFFIDHRRQIAELGLRFRLPTMFSQREYLVDGGFMSYGEALSEFFRRSAYYVDKILKGAKPVDLPVEQPIRFLLAINLKTAKALGLTVPPSLLVRADEVIE